MNRIITKFVVASQKNHKMFENRICALPVSVTIMEVLDLISLAVDYMANKDYKAFHRGIREIICHDPNLITEDEKVFVDQFILHIQTLSFPVR